MLYSYVNNKVADQQANFEFQILVDLHVFGENLGLISFQSLA